MKSAPWFDREEVLKLLRKRAEGVLAGYRQNLALLGPEGMGKSMLLKRFLHGLSGTLPPFVSVYVEVRPAETFSEWAARFVQTVLCGVAEADRSQRAGAARSDLFGGFAPDTADLMRICAAAAPQTAAAAKRLLALAEAQRLEEAYDALWDLPSLAAQETAVPSLLVLDEFHRLAGFAVRDPFGRLGRKIMMQNSTMYLVASSQTAAARSILREGLNLLFGQFETVLLGPLDPAVCLRAVHAAAVPEKRDPFLDHLIVELAQGVPDYLDCLLQGWMDQPSGGEVLKGGERSFLDLLESLLLAPQGSLRQRFEERLRSLPAHQSRGAWNHVLTAVAAGHHRLPLISRATGRSASQVSSALKALEGAGLVEKQGVFYRLPDRLFQLWMVTAYPVLRGLDLTDPARARARFRDVAWAWMRELKEAGRRPLEQHGLALLKRWGGELVEVEGRRTSFPRFDRVELLPRFGGRSAIVAHRSQGRGWLVVAREGPLEEGQARLLVHEISALPFKEYRKILLGPHPVEVNARLVFQESGIRLWDLFVLNNLLDLYGLDRIPFPGLGHPGFSQSVPVPAGPAAVPANPEAFPVSRARGG